MATPLPDNTTTTATTTTTNNNNNKNNPLRLLLQCVDGAVPYLTPHLLEQCFPAQQVKDVLMLGLAVRDACIVPVFTDAKTNNKGDSSKTSKKKNRSKKQTPQQSTTTTKKPSGYTFASSSTSTTNIDSWLLPFPRVTVPTFDPNQDALRFAPPQTAVLGGASGNQHVMVWTDNGRLTLTTANYHQAALEGLPSPVTVALFDDCGPNATERRQRTAVERTMQWWRELLDHPKNQDHHDTEIWATCLVVDARQDESSLDDDTNTLMEQQYTALQQHQKKSSPSFDGVVLVGWQSNSTKAQPEQQSAVVLESTVARLTQDLLPTTTLAVLSTRSLQDVLECYRVGIHVIGTNLPATWAREKRAFVCDYQFDCDFDFDKSSSSNNENRPKRPRLESRVLDIDGCVPVVGKTNNDSNGNQKDNNTSSSWIRDDGPILAGCTCLTCQTHSRAYLYHLVMTKELLAEILLFIHNLHHMLALVRALGQARTNGQQEEIYRYIQSQLPLSNRHHNGGNKENDEE